ncbi:UNVERIFIED_CONTAM: hypothetical protein NCL1_19881 [Trichonephila clavipes]
MPMLQSFTILKRASTLEGQLKRCLGSNCMPGQCLHSTYDLEPSGRIFMPLKCFVLSLVAVVSFWFATALASKTVVDEVTGSSVLASLTRESVISFSLMSIWAGIHWRVHDLTNAPMKNRSELISWVSPIFPSLMALRADLQSESTMMPSELEIFVRVSSPVRRAGIPASL